MFFAVLILDFFLLLTCKPYVPDKYNHYISRTARAFFHVVSIAQSALPLHSPVIHTLSSSAASSHTAPSSRKASLTPPHKNYSLPPLCSENLICSSPFYVAIIALSLDVRGIFPLPGTKAISVSRSPVLLRCSGHCAYPKTHFLFVTFSSLN